MAWMALVIMRMIVHPPNGLLREAVRILPDTLRLIRGLAADPTLPRAVRIRLAPLRSESFVPSLLSVPPGSFFGFLAPADGCFARRVGAVIAVRSGPLASGSATAIASPGHPSAGPPRPRNLQRNEKCDRTAICSPPAEGPLVSSNETRNETTRPWVTRRRSDSRAVSFV